MAAGSETPPRWLESERHAQEIESQVLRPMAKAWRAHDLAASQAALGAQAVMCDLSLPAQPNKSFDGIRQYNRAAQPAPARDAVQKFLGAAKIVDDMGLTVLDVAEDGLSAELWLDLRARMADGSLRTDRGSVNATFERADGKLRIAALSCPSLETLVSERPMFQESTRASGLGAVAVTPREEAIRRGGYALAVSDFDGDGWPDVYVGGRGPGQLLRNVRGQFVDVTKKAGLGADTMGKAALFADLDNDGRVDLLVQRFVDDENAELKFYRNLGDGRFAAPKAQVKRLRKHDRPMGMAAADFNDDGRLDIYVGYPGVRDFTDSAVNPEAPASHQAVYLNRGGWVFEEAPESSRPGSAIFGALVRPHSALGLDLNHDGRQDLMVIDDRGSPTRFYLNMGLGRFEERQDQAGLANSGWGMTAAAGDFAGDGRDAVYFSNVDFNAGHRILRFIEREGGPDAKAPGFERMKANLGGNRLYRSHSAGIGDIAFEDVTKSAGVGWAGEAPAGAVWVDYNSDGLPDLYVTNGLWSADRDCSADSSFIIGQLSEAKPTGIEDPNRVMRGLQKSGCSLGGYQRNRMFRNNGDGTFTETGYVIGADRIEDGYVAAVGDFDRDGRVDLLLRNTDPPSLKYAYPAVTLLLNRGAAGRTLAVSLTGRDPVAHFGALVTAKLPDGRQVSRQLRTVEGAVQSEPVVYLGLGDAASADIEVLWPSGTVDRVKGAKPGRINVTEGKGSVTAAPKSPAADGVAAMDALYYGLYTALARQDPAACAAAGDARHDISLDSGRSRTATGEWLCKSYYHHMTFFASFVAKDAGFAKACADFMRFEVPSTTPAEAADICRIAAANHDDPAALCAKQVAAGYRNPREVAQCEKDYRALNGDAAACEGFDWTAAPAAQIMERCPYQALWRARSGDPSACDRLEGCRALNGDAAALAERYRQLLFGAVSGPIPDIVKGD